MFVGLVGLSHKTAPIEVRDVIALPMAAQQEMLTQLCSQGLLQEAVVLTTCNRTEVYGVYDGQQNNQAVEQYLDEYYRKPSGYLQPFLYRLIDEQAIVHLFRVVASLDSMVVGEQQILGQVKEAYLFAQTHKTTGLVLNRLFQQALEVGKRVRTETDIGHGAVSVSSVAVELAGKIFGDLSGHSAMIFGAGEMSELTARHLLDKGIETLTVANRSYDRAVQLAQQIGGEPLRYDQSIQRLAEVDIVISSTSAPHYILSREQMAEIMQQRRNRPVFLIDLAVPRDIDPQVRSVYNVFLYNIDDLQSVAKENMARRQHEVEQAQKIIAAEVQRWLSWYSRLHVGPTIAALRRKAELIRVAEVQRALKKLSSLTEAEQRCIEKMSEAIINKVLHGPTVRLRKKADTQEGLQQIDAIRELFDL